MNVLFIQSDQMTYRAVAYGGNRWVRTPNIDRLVREGVAFTNAIAPAPFCSPTRASWLTGLYPHRHGITYNVGPNRRPLTEDRPLLVNAFHRGGYTMFHRGKWHLGNRQALTCYRDDPDDQADRMGRLRAPVRRRGSEKITMVPAVERAWAEVVHAVEGAKGAVTIGCTDLPPEQMNDSLVTDAVMDLMERHRDKPFFATCSLSFPHPPFVVPEPYYSMYPRESIDLPNNQCCPEHEEGTAARRIGRALGEEGIREYRAVYHGMVSMVDWNVGRLLDKLDDLGLTEQTLVVFASDHGDMVGARGMAGKTVRGLYEELIHVPLVMRFPGRIPAGERCHTPVSMVDIMPTLLDYAGLPIPDGLDGTSLRPVLEGREDLDRVVFSERTNRTPCRAAWTSRWRYTWFADGFEELYDLDVDAGEAHNLAADPAHAAIRADLHNRLMDWMRRTNDLALERAGRSEGGAAP